MVRRSEYLQPEGSFVLLILALSRDELSPRRETRFLLIRIALVIPTLDQSGAERQLSLLATGLPSEQYQVQVFALNRGGFFQQSLRAAAIPVTILGKRFRFDPLTWLRLRRALHAFRPEIVQSYLFSANSYVRLPGVCPAGCRIIVSERCVDSWKNEWQLWLDRRLAGTASAMIANSDSVAEFYHSVGIAKSLIRVIRNGVPVSELPPDRQWIRTKFGFSAEDRLVGFVGRLAPQKRLRDLIWAFQLLHQVVENVRLVLIGDGPERDALAELAQKLGCRSKVVFTGHRTDAYRLMQGLDAFCLPSEFEGMSNSLMEAMSLGLPIVASDIPSNRELITDGQTGLTFPLGQSPELTTRLKRILDNRQLADALGSSARRQIIEQFSVDRMVQQHRQLYSTLLQHHGAVQENPEPPESP